MPCSSQPFGCLPDASGRFPFILGLLPGGLVDNMGHLDADRVLAFIGGMCQELTDAVHPPGDSFAGEYPIFVQTLGDGNHTQIILQVEVIDTSDDIGLLRDDFPFPVFIVPAVAVEGAAPRPVAAAQDVVSAVLHPLTYPSSLELRDDPHDLDGKLAEGV